MRISAVRFFWVTTPPPRTLFMLWAALTGGGLWWMLSGASNSTGLFAVCLYLQMFAVSSGFMPSARAGHFDPLLGGLASRVRSTAAHWLLSSVPGLAAWVVLGSVEWLISESGGAVAFRTSSLAAIALVSTVAWILTLPFSRWAGAVMWTASLVTVASTQSGGELLQAASVVPRAGSEPEGLATLGTVVFCPFLLLTSLDQAPARADFVALGVLAVAATALVSGVCLVAWRDYALDG